MKCATKFCRGVVHKNAHSPFCAKCRSRRFKEKHPLKYRFNLLRNRARERGKEFDLTFAQFQKFCADTDYDKLTGKHSFSLSIDRRDATKGYSESNIRAITLSENSRLRWENIPAYLKEEMIAADSESSPLSGDRA